VIDKRAEIVAEALTWAGTPYHHHARIKGLGVDCAQILAAVYGTCGLCPADLDLGNYAREWHLHRGDELYLDRLLKLGGRRVDGEPRPGDIGVWRFGRTFAHGGIVIEGGGEPLILHAYINRGVILSRASEDPLQDREHQFWSVTE
jgi:cell wall-associated NlpC family hydrolase